VGEGVNVSSRAALLHPRSMGALGLLALLIGCVPAAAASGGDPARQLDSLFAAVPHARFEWTNVKGTSARATMRVPVDLVFDTGSSAFDIIVDLDDWIRFTGQKDPDGAPIQKKVNSWGSKVTAIGAPALGPLTIGSAHLPNPKVYGLKEQPNLFSGWPFPARGLVGNAPFWDRVVILDLGIRPRFGLLGSGS
jgi:hypothetical protein